MIAMAYLRRQAHISSFLSSIKNLPPPNSLDNNLLRFVEMKLFILR